MRAKQVALALLYIVLAAVIVFAVVSTKGFGLLKKNSNDSGWQAVFLTNGQVYFGHLAGMQSQFATLTNIYYLQVDQQQGLQPTDNKTSTAPAQQPKVTLIKLGNELHGPQDSMSINRDQILFVEDMKSDSKVVSAIDQYIKNPPSPSASATP